MNNIFIILFLFPFFTNSQNTSEHAYTFNWFDEIIGYKSLGLENGMKYVNTFAGRTLTNNHLFFKSNQTYKGNLDYNGNVFYNVDLKYDIYNDELIFQSKNSKGVIMLVKEKVANFEINDSYFINVNEEYENGKKILGFHELIYKNKYIKLFKKHSKTDKEVFIGEKIRYKFILKNNYLLFKEKYFDVNTKMQLIGAFPKSKKYIKKYYQENSNLKKIKPDIFIENLISELISLNNY